MHSSTDLISVKQQKMLHVIQVSKIHGGVQQSQADKDWCSTETAACRGSPDDVLATMHVSHGSLILANVLFRYERETLRLHSSLLMANKTWPGTGQHETFVVSSEHVPKIREGTKYFRLVPLLCHRNGVKVPGNPLALYNTTVEASQTTISWPQKGLLITQVASTALTSLLV